MGLPILSYKQADKIRRELMENPYKGIGIKLAEKYGVCPATISMVKNNVIWVDKKHK